ncbi:tetratricopeptide repeat protein [Nonomuraea endophytica]|uniref:Tetratricopeptide (TPR) repeat protein n=1 Tax=Nonomuraea endophytica TaxID=714136 RepID=A0A7W8A3I1_9ACTN|nr:tetratricopeptide repeat protein [Nonomuraea endophytica]MBB5078868.1 tetratricopeptide (TPR) repeat protein [Nonomuraea endophytica]
MTDNEFVDGESNGAAFVSSYAQMPKQERHEAIKNVLKRRIGDNSFGWIADLATIATETPLELPEVRSLVADLAWISRESGERIPDFQGTGAPANATLHHYLLIQAYVIGQRLRYDFRFEALHDKTQIWLSEFEGDALILSFAAFGALGLRLPQGLSIYKQAIASPNADRRSRHVCLSGMWHASHIADQPNELLALSDQMLGRGESDSNVFFRRASAHRRLGNFEEALEAIDHAIDMLEPGNNRVHQDYAREREFVSAMQDMRGYAKSLTSGIGREVLEVTERRIEEASEALDRQVEAAQKVVSDALLKIVEILGLFVTLLAFLIGSGAVALKATTFGEGALAMTLAVVGAIIFFVLIRIVVSFRRRR